MAALNGSEVFQTMKLIKCQEFIRRWSVTPSTSGLHDNNARYYSSTGEEGKKTRGKGNLGTIEAVAGQNNRFSKMLVPLPFTD